MRTLSKCVVIRVDTHKNKSYNSPPKVMFRGLGLRKARQKGYSFELVAP
jgi:hypothetical protein